MKYKFNARKATMRLIELEMTKAELQRRSGLVISAIHMFFSGKRNPRTESVQKLLHALECEFDDLFDIVEDSAS